MKTLSSLALLLFVSTNALAALTYMPEHYLTGEEVSQNAKADDFKPTANFVDSVLKTEKDILEAKDLNDLEAKKSKKFQMNLMMTNLTVTRSGLVGISALKASEFVSLFWTRKRAETKAVSEEVRNKILFDGEATQEELDANAVELSDTLYNAGLVKNKETLLQNLKSAMTKANETFGAIETMSYGNWDVSGLRLDLSVSVSGIVTPYTKIGASTRVWVEWRRVNKPAASVGLTKGAKRLQDFVGKVLRDVDLSASNVNLKSFHLSQMYVGLGQDYKTGFFGLGSSNFGFIGYVILNHKPGAATVTKVVDANDDMPVVKKHEKLKNIFSVSRRKLRKSIQKTLNLASRLVDNAEKVKSDKWEVSRIRLTTTLSKSGFFGLSALNTKGVFIHIFERTPLTASAPEETPEQTYHQWELSLVRISFVADIGVEIPWIANATLQPQTEFIWR